MKPHHDDSSNILSKAESRKRMKQETEISSPSSFNLNINTSSGTIHSLHSLDCNYLNHHPSARLFTGVRRK